MYLFSYCKFLHKIIINFGIHTDQILNFQELAIYSPIYKDSLCIQKLHRYILVEAKMASMLEHSTNFLAECRVRMYSGSLLNITYITVILEIM